MANEDLALLKIVEGITRGVEQGLEARRAQKQAIAKMKLEERELDIKEKQVQEDRSFNRQIRLAQLGITRESLSSKSEKNDADVSRNIRSQLESTISRRNELEKQIGIEQLKLEAGAGDQSRLESIHSDIETLRNLENDLKTEMEVRRDDAFKKLKVPIQKESAASQVKLPTIKGVDQGDIGLLSSANSMDRLREVTAQLDQKYSSLPAQERSQLVQTASRRLREIRAEEEALLKQREESAAQSRVSGDIVRGGGRR